MRSRIIQIFLICVTVLVTFSGCGDPVSNRVASRGRFRVARWMRYEFRQVRNFSYGESQIKEKYHVLGYEPSWLIYDSLYLNYPFELMSDLIVGEYDVNPNTGFARNDSALNAYKNKSILEMATAVNSQINLLLSVTDYGDFGYRRKFLSEISKKNLINSLDHILDDFGAVKGSSQRKGVGLFIDIPNVPWNIRKDYAEFIARLRKDLDNEEQDKNCLIYAVLPPRDQYQSYSDTSFSQKLNRNVDLFVIRAHNFDQLGEKNVFGPTLAPFGKSIISLDSTLRYYTEKAKIPRKKIIIELPFYGKCWTTDSTLNYQRPLIPLSEIMNTMETPAEFDFYSYCWKKKMDTLSYYYEDTLTLYAKYSKIIEENLGGVSLYGLGYAHGLDDTKMEESFWKAIAVNFAEPAPRLLFPAIGYVLCFMSLGIIMSVINNWEVRYALRDNRRVLWYYVLLFLCIALAITMCVIPIETVSVMWKLISLAILLIFPLGRKAMKFLFMAAR